MMMILFAVDFVIDVLCFPSLICYQIQLVNPCYFSFSLSLSHFSLLKPQSPNLSFLTPQTDFDPDFDLSNRDLICSWVLKKLMQMRARSLMTNLYVRSMLEYKKSR